MESQICRYFHSNCQSLGWLWSLLGWVYNKIVGTSHNVRAECTHD